MARKYDEIREKINVARKKMEKLWEVKKRTDQEVLEAAEDLDKLLNEYSRLVDEESKKKG